MQVCTNRGPQILVRSEHYDTDMDLNVGFLEAIFVPMNMGSKR
jgi:hypothetical protein